MPPGRLSVCKLPFLHVFGGAINTKKRQVKRPLKIAILLPAIATIGIRRQARNLAIALSETKDPVGDVVEVVIGLPRLEEEIWRRQEQELRGGWKGCVVRHLGWERVASDLAGRMYPAAVADVEGVAEVMLPRDWGWNFVDCDAWIVMADAGLGAILPVKPTAYYVRDLAQRYVPAGYAHGIHDEFWARQTDSFRLWRQSPCVFTVDSATATDITSFGGVRRDRIVQIEPQPIRPSLDAVRSNGGARTLLWLVEPSASHDIGAALDGLRLFFAEGGDLKVIVAGEGAAAFAQSSAGQLGGVPMRALSALQHLEVEVVVSDSEVQRLLRRVDMVWSSSVAEGENEGLARAAQAGLPFIGLSYPQNSRFAAQQGVAATWYSESEPAAIADALATAAARERPTRLKASGPAASKSKRSAGHLSVVVERLWSAKVD